MQPSYISNHVCFFSILFFRETKALARAGLRNPATISVAVKSRQQGSGDLGPMKHKTQATPSSLENFYITCEPEEKLAQLVSFLKVGGGDLRQNEMSRRLGEYHALRVARFGPHSCQQLW